VAAKDRQRALARAKLERQMAKRAASARRRRQWQAGLGAVLAVAAVVAGSVYVVNLLGGEDETKPAAAKEVSCEYKPGEKPAKDVGAPKDGKPTVRGTWTATITTNHGVIQVDLDAENAPCTVGSFTYLANKKYFDATPCHRMVTVGIYVLQCGDPTGKGTGGPGYQFANENLPAAKVSPTYPAGTLAMANSGPNTNGSQFFVVYKDTPDLPADYSVFGKVTQGLDVVEKIAAGGVTGEQQPGSGDGAPKTPVKITSIVAKPSV
jgi:peptidyl-prolyl cis-trans isomerase B (cyclophilin B)